jgi:alpha-beta hydrolase superfamily lysophospholipase
MNQQRQSVFESKGARISALAQWPDGAGPFATVVMCHGLTNSMFTCPLINEAAEEFLRAGYAVFRFDFFGSGDSDGIFEQKTISVMVDNLKDAFKYIKQAGPLDPRRVCLWGRSVGAVVALLGTRYKLPLATVLISPPFHLHQTFYRLFEKQGQADYTSLSSGGAATGLVKGEMRLPRAYFMELKRLDTRLQAAARGLRTVRIMQGDSDQKVGVPGVQALYEFAGQPKDLVVVSGADHAFTGKESMVIGLAVEWLVRHAPPR